MDNLSSMTSGRRRFQTSHYTEDCTFDRIAKDAESRLIAKRQARTEAREIRMQEIERQQKEIEGNAVFDIYTPLDVDRGCHTPSSKSSFTPNSTNSYQSNRHNSVGSLDESHYNFRDFKMELKELEEKFRKSMVQNDQLHNEKSLIIYTVELYKDKFTDIEEELIHINKKNKEYFRENENLKRLLATQKSESIALKNELDERDRLIREKGLVIISTNEKSQINNKIKRTLVSVESAKLLQDTGEEDSLDIRLKKINDERNGYINKINSLKLELQEAKNHIGEEYSDCDNFEDAQKETNKVYGDYKFKLQKAEQNISTLQANIARLESQVIRYKTASDLSEKEGSELKIEKRKLQRELRESLSKIEELETSNMHLLKRFDKLKNAKSSLLKDL